MNRLPKIFLIDSQLKNKCISEDTIQDGCSIEMEGPLEWFKMVANCS